MKRYRLSFWGSALLAIVAATAALGCGDSSSDDGDAKASTAAEAPVRAAYERIQTAIMDKDPKAFCAMLTAQAREATGAAGGQNAPTCEKYLALVMTNSEDRVPPKLVGVEVKGNRAFAVVRVAKRPPTRIPFVKQAGEWKTDQALGTPN